MENSATSGTLVKTKMTYLGHNDGDDKEDEVTRETSSAVF